jgi:formylglycine-generating enzyme required for sulfatase activity
LLLTYPTDQHLIKAKAFLDEALASAKPAEVALPAEFAQPAVVALPTASKAFSYTAGKNHTITLPNNVALDLVWIPSGTFTMGSPPSEGGYSCERPAHRVTISKGFWLGKTLVTQGQYQAVMGTNPSDFTKVGADAPVDTVSWDDAMEFCRKLTEQERATGRIPEGYAYTLPTEAQWEYACRAGTTGALYGKLNDIAWYYGNSGDSTHPVGQKQPNAFGLYDMIGSVWEWCSDWYGNDYSAGNVTDPAGPDSGLNRVVRGGWWGLTTVYCRSAFRSDYDPSIHFNFIGFRLALAPSRKDTAHTQSSP